jgi:Zn-dependent protease with chaperone function
MRKKLRVVYLLVIAFVLVIIATGLLYAGTHIDIIVLAGLGLISIVSSLVPFFASMYVLKKYEAEAENTSYKVFGIALYLCCFPIKIGVAIATIYETLFGSNHWAFG